jgi:hypothetical protein
MAGLDHLLKVNSTDLHPSQCKGIGNNQRTWTEEDCQKKTANQQKNKTS